MIVRIDGDESQSVQKRVDCRIVQGQQACQAAYRVCVTIVRKDCEGKELPLIGPIHCRPFNLKRTGHFGVYVAEERVEISPGFGKATNAGEVTWPAFECLMD